MSATADEDRKYLEEAIRLSRERMEAGLGGPFGAVIVKDGVVLAEGWNEVTSALDPTAHAEVTAIRKACRAVNDFSLDGATIYSSCEPCPMCLAAIYWSRCGRLVYANTREQAARIGFDDAMIYDEIPKAPTTRSLATTHLPLPEASAVFESWTNKTDKIEY